MSLYFKKEKLLFVHIPKNAGSSFKKWTFANLKKGNYVKFKTHADLNQCLQTFPDTQQSFCFVRNPYERIVSMYHFIGQRAEQRLAGLRTKANISPKQDNEIVEYYKLGIDNFIKDLFHNTSTPYTVGWRLSMRKRTQCSYVSKDTVPLKIENVSKDFAYIQNILNCHVPLFSSNTTVHTGRSEMSDQSKQLVQRMFLPDFIEYGYDFEA